MQTWFAAVGNQARSLPHFMLKCGLSLHRVWCSKLTGPGVLLLGDAAHAVTPVGGQGANAALEDCLFLDGVLEATGQPTQILLVLSLAAALVAAATS